MKEERIFLCRCTRQMHTVALMDTWERRLPTGEKQYEILRLMNCLTLYTAHGVYAVDVIVRRWDGRTEFCNDRMTFSRLKRQVAGRGFHAPYTQAPALVRQAAQACTGPGRRPLPCAVLLHAQHSGNRVGHQTALRGTRYGETSIYMCTEAVYTRKEV